MVSEYLENDPLVYRIHTKRFLDLDASAAMRPGYTAESAQNVTSASAHFRLHCID